MMVAAATHGWRNITRRVIMCKTGRIIQDTARQAQESPAMKLSIALSLVLLILSCVVPAAQARSENSGLPGDFDLDGLIHRVTKSKALGFLTKLSLKQEIDRLLESIRQYHNGTGNDSLEQLHERYDLMVHKLVTLVQNKDEELVKSIDDGRDKLWAILADEHKFAKL